jgi:hypothetical protein
MANCFVLYIFLNIKKKVLGIFFELKKTFQNLKFSLYNII